MNGLKRIGLILLLIGSWASGWSQGMAELSDSNRIQIIHADYVEYDREFSNAQRFVGNVKMSHRGALLHCDSAYLFLDSNSVRAYNNVKIFKGDSLSLFGDTLNYTGNNQLADIRGNVRFNDRDISLNTTHLAYDLGTETGTYTHLATITSTKNQNTLTSKRGWYFSNFDTFQFSDSVVLQNPKYKMTSDTLVYNNGTERAFFHGPTLITAKDNEIYCENGWYDTQTDQASFAEHAYIISDGRKLKGDSLYYDRNKGLGEVFGNLEITDTVSNIIVFGQYGWHDENAKKTLVTDSLMLVQIMDNDSLYLHSDTVFVENDSLDKRLIKAYRKVRFYKSDMQGVCDSLLFDERDSTIKMYYEPVLWNEGNQLTSDFIWMKMDSGQIDQLFMDDNAFVISEADTIGYNQMKGRNMVADFEANKIKSMHIIGNAESIYYIAEEGKPPVGMNTAKCSNITIYVNDNKIENIHFVEQPDAILYPMNQVTPDNSIIEGFHWRSAERPLTPLDIFL